MNVVYTVTASFQPLILPSLRSLLEHNPEAKIYVLTETDRLQAEMPCPVTVVNISGQKIFPESGVNYRTPFSWVNLLKVAYADLLPELDKVLHLDADTIVCEDLTPLWETDIKGKWFAAVREDKGSYHPFGDVYYNAGVLLVNLTQMRKDGIIPEMVDYLNIVPQPYADQDAWNKYAIEQDKAVALPVRYNENFATGQTAAPAIVHFCGFKDWWNMAGMPRAEYLERYK